MNPPSFFDKLALGVFAGSKIVEKWTVGDHLQVFALERGGKRSIGLRHSHGGDIKYYAYPAKDARLLAEKILALLPPQPPAGGQTG